MCWTVTAFHSVSLNTDCCFSLLSIHSSDSHSASVQLLLGASVGGGFLVQSVFYLLPAILSISQRRLTRTSFPGLLGESLLCWTHSYLMSRFIRLFIWKNGGSGASSTSLSACRISEERGRLMKCRAVNRSEEIKCRNVCHGASSPPHHKLLSQPQQQHV